MRVAVADIRRVYLARTLTAGVTAVDPTGLGASDVSAAGGECPRLADALWWQPRLLVRPVTVEKDSGEQTAKIAEAIIAEFDWQDPEARSSANRARVWSEHLSTQTRALGGLGCTQELGRQGVSRHY
jgi:hypothetical protein